MTKSNCKCTRGWLALLLAGLLWAPTAAAGAPDARLVHDYRVKDAGLFQQELQTAGALKFCDNTEDLLRTGQFEGALLRYFFLKRQISAQAGYRPLVHLINQRLDFLKDQLKLPAADYAALQGRRIRKRLPVKTQVVPAVPPEAASPNQKTAADAGKALPAQAGETAMPSPTPLSPPQEALAAAPSSQTSGSQTKSADDQIQEKEPPEAPPSPPPSRWQRLKRRLLFWRR